MSSLDLAQGDDLSSRDAASAVHLGLWVSATRCVLTYVIAPALGALGVVLGPVGLVLQLLGAVTSAYGAATLWRLGHRLRFVYAAVALAIGAATLLTLGQTIGGVLR